MSAVNEATEMWAEIRREEQEKAQKRKAANLAVLRASVIPFQIRNDGDVVLVRDKGYPGLDFWPSKNKWSVGGRTMMGDAGALIEFLKRRAL